MRRGQRILAIVVTFVMVFAMVGATVIGYFWGGTYSEQAPIVSDQSNGTNPATEPGSEYELLKQAAAELNQQVEDDPQNIDLWTELGNTYYDLAVAAMDAAPEEVTADLHQAVDIYQYVLQYREDVNVMLDLATAAYYLEDDDLAEENFRKALNLEPDNYYALYNYGVFLYYAREDFNAAIEQWEKALVLNPQDEQLQAFIAEAKLARDEAQKNTTP